MAGLSDAFSLPYVFEHEGLFVLGTSVLIIGLLVVRAGLHRRLGNKPSGARPEE
jgi:hydrogenase-4 membrane subunit HyfE